MKVRGQRALCWEGLRQIDTVFDFSLGFRLSDVCSRSVGCHFMSLAFGLQGTLGQAVLFLRPGLGQEEFFHNTKAACSNTMGRTRP